MIFLLDPTPCTLYNLATQKPNPREMELATTSYLELMLIWCLLREKRA